MGRGSGHDRGVTMSPPDVIGDVIAYDASRSLSCRFRPLVNFQGSYGLLLLTGFPWNAR